MFRRLSSVGQFHLELMVRLVLKIGKIWYFYDIENNK